MYVVFPGGDFIPFEPYHYELEQSSDIGICWYRCDSGELCIKSLLEEPHKIQCGGLSDECPFMPFEV